MSKYTKAVVDAMNSEQYLEKFNNDPEFRLYIDGEYSQATPKEAVAAPPQIGKRGPRDRKEVATVVAPQTRGFDPSFDDDPNANTPPAAPAAVVPVAVPVDPATVVPP